MATTQQTPTTPTEPVVAPPQDPAEPAPFEITGTPETGFELRYSTGEVYKGKTEREVLEANARGTADTKLSWRELKHELEELKGQQQRVADALQPPSPPPTPQELEEEQMRQYLGTQQAKLLGLSDAKELVERFQFIQEVAEEMRGSRMADEFRRDCPDFSETPENVEKLMAVLTEYNWPKTLNNVKAAHAVCIREERYKPLSKEEVNAQLTSVGLAPQRATPPPTLPTGQPEMSSGKNLWEMTPDEIRKDYFDRLARGEK